MSGTTGDDSPPKTPERQIRSNNNLSLDPNRAWQSIRDSQLFQDVPTVAARDSAWNTPQSDCTRIVCMSDTHGRHAEIAVPKGDVLVHGGDFTSTGEVSSISELMDYFRAQHFPHIICTAGNHDMTLHESFYKENWKRFHPVPLNAKVGRKSLETLMEETAGANSERDFQYLEDRQCMVPIHNGDDINHQQPPIPFYGSPWTPEFYNWAFNLPRGQPSWDAWAKIPDETDVLVTHGPPLGRGDLCTHGGRAGCYDLLEHVQQRVKPRVQIFGHIHEGYGASFDGTTLFVNASNLDLDYKHVHPCIVIDLPHDKNQSARIVQPQCNFTGNDFLAMIGEKGNYKELEDALGKSGCKGEDFPSGNNLLQSADAYREVCSKIDISGDQKSQVHRDLRMALSQLHASSF